MASIKIAQLVENLEKQGLNPSLQGDGAKLIDSVQSLDLAEENQLSFLNDPSYIPALATSRAGCVLLNAAHAENFSGTAIIVENPYAAYAYAVQLIYPQTSTGLIHDSAQVAEDAKVADGVAIGPNAVVGSGVTLKAGVVIGAGCVIEKNVSIGESSRLEANVTIMHSCILGSNCVIKSGAVIGGDGFGFAKHNEKWVKIPQVGRVIIGNNVFIGNNSTLDRGAIQDTIVGNNCIIDNLVHLAHNVEIGDGSVIVALAGVAGSTKIGKNATLAAQVGVVGHIELADNVTLMARTGVTKDIKEAGVYAGFPAVPFSQWQKSTVYQRGLPKLYKQVKDLDKRFSD